MMKKTPTRHTAAPKLTPAAKTAATPAAVTPVATAAVATPAVVAASPVITPAAPAVAVKPAPVELITQLQDPSAEVAVEAAAELATLGDARAIEPLLRVLGNADGYCHVVTRAAAAMALGHFQDARVVTALTAAAKDEMAEVSREAVLALGELKATAAGATLIAIAANHDGFYLNTVRHAAVRSLGRMKALDAKSTLTAIANDGHADPALTAAAREALTQL